MDNDADTAHSSAKPSITDDESASACTTESEIYESWTLVTDKQKKNKTETANDSNNKIEILNSDLDNSKRKPVSEAETEADDDSKADKEPNIDDLSDGISIISESESAGRISPHPTIREHLRDMNMTFDSLDDATFKPELTVPIVLPASGLELENKSPSSRELRQRRVGRSSSERKALQRHTNNKVEIDKPLLPLIRCLCYIALLGIVVGLIFSIVFPSWNNDVVDLRRRITDLELQNNFFNKKIETLAQQMSDWSSDNDKFVPGQARKMNEMKMEQQRKRFAAWSGLGDSLDPVRITKNNLKQPFDCADEGYDEFAGMCVEKKTEANKLMDEMSKVMDDVLQQSEAYQTFEDVVAEVDSLTEDPLGKQEQRKPLDVAQYETNNQIKVESTKHTSADDKNKQPRFPTAKQEKLPKFRQSLVENDENAAKHKHHHHHEIYAKRQEKEWKHDKQHRIKEQNAERSSMESHEDDDDIDFKKHDYNSKERFNKPNGKYNAKEHNGRFNSKEHNGRFNSKEQEDKSGEWHEKRMQNRDYVRRQNDRYRENKNWFIERGDSREQLRQS